MLYTTRNSEAYEVKSCVCGDYPKFVIPDYNYTDCWLECPKCGRRTKNTGGYHYAMEIHLSKAKRKAVELWNRNEVENNG